MARWLASLFVAAVCFAASAAAAPVGQVTEFPASPRTGTSVAGAIAPGPDGNLWFTETGFPPAIGRITPSGTITEFSAGLQASNASLPIDIAPGPDGNMWFIDLGDTRAIGRITPDGAITEFSTGLQPGNTSRPIHIAAGPDGNLWFTDGGNVPAIGRITPRGAITEFSAGLQASNNSAPLGIAPGPDGNVWFTDPGSTLAIGRITPSGTITEFSDTLLAGGGSVPMNMAPGPDGNTWFTVRGQAAVGRIAPSGRIVLFSAGLQDGNHSVLTSISPGPDGNLWFTDNGGIHAIGRITPSGVITEFSDGLRPGNASFTASITPGPDGNLWFADQSGTTAIGRIGAGAPAASVRAPSVAGSGQQGTQHVCEGDVWAQWAGQPPSYGVFQFDGYQWQHDGSPIAGAISQQYTPTAGDVGHRLSCVLTVTYQFLGVTVSATSARVAVIPQASGPQGSPGPTGAPGKVELVTCKTITATVIKKLHGKRRKVHVKRQVCTAKLVSGPVKFTTPDAIRASLSRGRTTAAIGIAIRAGRRLLLLLRCGARLQPGPYTVHLADHEPARVIVT